jgi:hypothetical protein
MPDPTGRWVNAAQWQCPKCLWVNESARERCQKCDGSLRPSEDEPVRAWDALDVVGRPDPVELATQDRIPVDERH